MDLTRSKQAQLIFPREEQQSGQVQSLVFKGNLLIHINPEACFWLKQHVLYSVNAKPQGQHLRHVTGVFVVFNVGQAY